MMYTEWKLLQGKTELLLSNYTPNFIINMPSWAWAMSRSGFIPHGAA